MKGILSRCFKDSSVILSWADMPPRQTAIRLLFVIPIILESPIIQCRFRTVRKIWRSQVFDDGLSLSFSYTRHL